ncbi:transthyretin [Coprinopsis sp. MPI-PUGE-AT-0042]|nr:transthyretin [Coprinopsis sp. MPI-PUGE-AT-0042]
MSKSPITCHVLDSSIGKPAEGVEVILFRLDGSDFTASTKLGSGVTNSDGRCSTLLPAKTEGDVSTYAQKGSYKIIFRSNEYFANSGRASFYPWVEIPFTIQNPEEHYHIPLLISPYSYTTYRGS